MQFFRQWAISVCATGIIGTIFSMISPKGSMNKILKLMIAVFIITSILAPFLTGGNKTSDLKSAFENNSAQTVNEDDMWEQANRLSLKTAAKSIEKTVSEFLINKGINEFEIKVNLEADSNRCVSVTSVDIYVLPEAQSSSVEWKAEVEKEFQFPINVFDIGAYEDEINKD